MGSNFRTKKLFSKTAKNALIAPFIYIGGQFLIEDQKQSKKKKVKSKMETAKPDKVETTKHREKKAKKKK